MLNLDELFPDSSVSSAEMMDIEYQEGLVGTADEPITISSDSSVADEDDHHEASSNSPQASEAAASMGRVLATYALPGTSLRKYSIAAHPFFADKDAAAMVSGAREKCRGLEMGASKPSSSRSI